MRTNILILIIIFIIVSACEKKINDNPYDPDCEIDWSPQNLKAEAISPYVVKIQWEILTTKIDFFKIDRKKESENWENDIASELGNNTTSWIDYYCDKNTDYTYRIYAVAGSNTSTEKTVTFTTPFGNPTGTFTDSRDGKIYKWVKIGNQTWMAENLAYIPFVCQEDTECGIWVLGYNGNNIEEAKSTEEYEVSGCLYNWAKAVESCPEGWHLPSKEEWEELIIYLGGYEKAVNKLLEAGDGYYYNAYYYYDIPTTNESGFTLLPSGRNFAGSFGFDYSSVAFAFFWTGLPEWWIQDHGMDYNGFMNSGSSNAYIMVNCSIKLSWQDMRAGYSVRCIKD